jgi:hypothetical protein
LTAWTEVDSRKMFYCIGLRLLALLAGRNRSHWHAKCIIRAAASEEFAIGCDWPVGPLTNGTGQLPCPYCPVGHPVRWHVTGPYFFALGVGDESIVLADHVAMTSVDAASRRVVWRRLRPNAGLKRRDAASTIARSNSFADCSLASRRGRCVDVSSAFPYNAGVKRSKTAWMAGQLPEPSDMKLHRRRFQSQERSCHDG